MIKEEELDGPRSEGLRSVIEDDATFAQTSLRYTPNLCIIKFHLFRLSYYVYLSKYLFKLEFHWFGILLCDYFGHLLSDIECFLLIKECIIVATVW